MTCHVLAALFDFNMFATLCHMISYAIQEVLNCLPPADFQVTDELIKEQKRKDFRDLCVFSIDPPGGTN